MQNIAFRYTRYINARKKRIGHLFQGRYKAILIDADMYLLELVRYIHNNPVRAKLTKTADQFTFSSHQAYLGKTNMPWLATDYVLSQFSENHKKAVSLYYDFVLRGSAESHREEFYSGPYENRILGDERFSEKSLAKAAEKYDRKLHLQDIIAAVCNYYNITSERLACPGKARPASEARAVTAVLVQDNGWLKLTELANYLKRDLATLSQAANRLRRRAEKDKALWAQIVKIKNNLA